ncbi:MAG: ArgR family transcriptional regulator [Legionellaceae bacterium]|nr:ArgR family transcriptional regulator [Legionellaceae bacterium]
MNSKSQDEPIQDILEDLRKLLLQGVNATQETICLELESMGHKVNQSKISRLLRKINAIKVKNDSGEMVYHLPHDATPPPINSSLSELVIDVVANEAMIIIKTSPGAASLIARIIDHKKCHILGTIAGDDSIFVAPESVHNLEKTMTLIRSSLNYVDTSAQKE